MGRQCKLQDTGEYSTTDVAFRAPNKKYYSSEDAWKRVETNNLYRNQCVDFLRDLLDYKEGMKLPTLTYKKIKEYENPYGLDVLLETMKNQKQACMWALTNKSFPQETAKISYLFAIFQNHAHEEWKKKVAEQKQKKVEPHPIEEEEMTEYVPHKQKDIRRFLS